MKKFTLILLFIVCQVGYAQSSPTANADSTGKINQIDQQGRRQGWWVITGRLKHDPTYAPDAKVEEGNYKDSQKTGVWIQYFPTGTKKSELTFVNNRPNGHAIMYNKNGTKSEEGTWVGTHWVGEYHLYYDDGTPRQNFNYNPTGQRDGHQVYTYPNGKTQIEVDMKGGKEDGWEKEYDENGNLVRETFYNGGVIDASKTKEYKTNAPVAVKAPEDPSATKAPPPPPPKTSDKANAGQFNGNGYWVLYRNGQITYKGTFKDYKLQEGEQRIYDNNMMLIQIKLYKGGRYTGDAPIPADANK